MLRESASSPGPPAPGGKSHVSEDPGEIEEVRHLFPAALDYVDVYDRAGALGERTILAHAIHLSDRELARLVECGVRVAHCPRRTSSSVPASCRSRAGRRPGSPSASDRTCRAARALDVRGRTRRRLRADGPALTRAEEGGILDPLGWLRLATLDGARALGLDDAIGSLEIGKEADLIAVDPGFVAPLVATSPQTTIRPTW
jgi:guanine deaminase